MTPHPVLVSPDASLQEAAKQMKKINCGILPVGTEKQLEGIITDRDIRFVQFLKEETQFRQKSVNICLIGYIHENNTLKEAADLMSRHKISRLIVDNEVGKVVGILSLGAILRKDADPEEIAKVVEHARSGKAA